MKVKNIAQKLIDTAIISATFALALTVNYIMPSYEKTVITGMEVRRMDKDGVISKSNPADGEVRDVYFIFTKRPEESSDKVMVYRNEDTGWGLPPYFKFDSADIQAKAQSYANDQKTVQMKYYGWRISMLNEFRNVTSIQPLSDNESEAIPIVSIILYCLIFFGGASLMILIRQKLRLAKTENEKEKNDSQ